MKERIHRTLIIGAIAWWSWVASYVDPSIVPGGQPWWPTFFVFYMWFSIGLAALGIVLIIGNLVAPNDPPPPPRNRRPSAERMWL